MKRIRYLFNRAFSVKIIILYLLFCTIGLDRNFFASESEILLQEIFPVQDINSMIELQKITWMPISSEYINSHKSNPPDKRLLPSFLSFVYGTMKNEWIPLDFKENIVYLQNGKYSEAVERNFFLFDTTITETDFAGGIINTCGDTFLVDYSGVDTCVVNTTPTLSFKVWDDEQITGDVPMPDTSDLERVFNPAYVLPVFDVGDNNDNVNFKLNVKATEFQSTLDCDSKPYNVNTFWIGYVLGGYQYLSVKDYDPDGETATGGVTDITYGGCIIFKETLQDTNTSFEPIAVDHEIGHLLGGEHTDGALMGPEGDTEFSPITLNRIRSIVKPTGN